MPISERWTKDHQGAGRMLAVVCTIVLVGDLWALASVGDANRGRASDLGRPGPESRANKAGVLPPAVAPDRPPTSPLLGDDGMPSTTTIPPVSGPVKHGWDFAATLAPSCAAIGRQFTLTVGLGVKGRSSIAVVYANGDNAGTHRFGEGGDDGTFTLTWVAPPIPGDGTVMIAAADASRSNGGTKAIPFRVVATDVKC